MTVFKYENERTIAFKNVLGARKSYVVKGKDLLNLMGVWQLLAGDTISPATQHAVAGRMRDVLDSMKLRR